MLVFFVAAAVGLGAYAAGGMEPAPLGRMSKLLTPGRAVMILAAAVVTLVLVMIVITSVALPGESLYVLKHVGRAYAMPGFVGFFFGLGFGVWVNYMVVPGGLNSTSARTAHRRWGLGLLILFLTGILYGPVDRLLPRLTGFSTPAVSLDFGKGGGEEEEPAVGGPGISVGSGDGGRRSLAVANAYLSSVNAYVVRDREYVRHLHGEVSADLSALQNKASRFIAPIVECLGFANPQRHDTLNTSAIQAMFGRAVADGTTWFQSVLMKNESKPPG